MDKSGQTKNPPHGCEWRVEIHKGPVGLGYTQAREELYNSSKSKSLLLIHVPRFTVSFLYLFNLVGIHISSKALKSLQH